MIASCPSCGTHYKHEIPSVLVHARCGRCHTSFDLVRLAPYRIVSAGNASRGPGARAAGRLPAIAARPPDPPDVWQEDEPLPPIPEMALTGAFASAVPSLSTEDRIAARTDDGPAGDSGGDEGHEDVSPAGSGATTFALWMATGAIAGTGASWTLGGTTVTGIAAGATLGAVAGLGWRRWTTQK